MDGPKLGIRLVVAALCLLAAFPAAAGTILLNSAAGLPYLNLNTTGQNPPPPTSGFTVTIGAHPLWEQNNPNGSAAVWISYADTGYGGTHFQPYLGATPVVTITDTFTAPDVNVLNLKVWADDSAGVYIDGVQVFAPITVQGSACSGAIIGCLPADAGVLTNYLLPAGTHTISFVLYQTGTATGTTSNPFGLLFTGSDTTVPEPAAALLTGAGLIALGLSDRIRRKFLRRG